ncbi:MAG: class I SAM-dependent methyltransferase [Spirochaetia bacterium]|nr:class I SAM-dependent methyltransferase [Spirochaetia bacterium]
MNDKKFKYSRKIDWVINILKSQIPNHLEIPFKISFFKDKSYIFGSGRPLFNIKINNENGFAAFGSFDQVKFCEAFMDEDIDIEGEIFQVMSIRRIFGDVHPLHIFLRNIIPLFTGQVKTDRKAISEHYEYDDDFYLSFLDKTRCYSQAIYECDDETLEDAQRRKLEFVMKACSLKKGSRVLDVGGGWGVFSEYAGLRGIQVTSLTISEHSEKYIRNLINRLKIPCKVKFSNFYEYSTDEKYDAIVILGVMEHLANYPAVIRQLYKLLKPNGFVYLDASSDRKLNSKPTFLARYVFPGNHSYFCLQEFLKQVAKSGFELKNVFNDRYSYYLTCTQWAKNLENARQKIVNRWGERLFRLFQIYLWGSAESFYHGTLDAYRVILQRLDVSNKMYKNKV